MPLFEVAVVEKPSKKKAEEGEGEALKFGPKCVVARDQQAAVIAAVMGDDFPRDIDRTRMEIYARPFA